MHPREGGCWAAAFILKLKNPHRFGDTENQIFYIVYISAEKSQ
jgi:hypothetical protein